MNPAQLVWRCRFTWLDPNTGNGVTGEQVHDRGNTARMLRVLPLHIKPRQNGTYPFVQATGQEIHVGIRVMGQHPFIIKDGDVPLL